MILLQKGDEVRVGGLLGSEWLGARGIVVKTVEHEHEGETIQECAVEFPRGRCWFQSKYLARSIPDRFTKFVRAEAIERWKDLTPGDVGGLLSDCDSVTVFLQTRYGFNFSRAKSEAIEFLRCLRERIALSREIERQPIVKSSVSGRIAAA